MPKITEIYKKYKITKTLQEHQLRVAAVAELICSSFGMPIDKQVVITACLLHDMGNILKFDFTANPQLFEPEGIDYWKRVREQVASKYNSQDEHHVSLLIAKELNVSHKVLECIESIDFGKTIEVVASPEFEPRICDYADLRATPHGVVSMDQRLEEGAKRYKNRSDKWLAEDVRAKVIQACHDNETEIFAHCKIKPTDITDQSIKVIFERLRTYEI
jgi:putative nucleotidyltransferase with HDIG domain